MDSISPCHVILLLTPVFSSKILIPPKEMVKKIFCLCSPLERAPATTPCWKEGCGFYFSVFIWKFPLVPQACQIPWTNATNHAHSFPPHFHTIFPSGLASSWCFRVTLVLTAQKLCKQISELRFVGQTKIYRVSTLCLDSRLRIWDPRINTIWFSC